MIITNTYFQGEIYLPHAKPGISDDVKLERQVIGFIEDYTYDCLIKSLGSRLFYEFQTQLDIEKANGLKDSVDAKWNELLNGHTYDNPAGNEVVWRGIRYKSSVSANYNRSFLADFVYFYYASNDAITKTGAGDGKIQSANATIVSGTDKSVKAWRKFVKLVQGTTFENPYFLKSGPFGGVGVDYQRTINDIDGEINLYQFINDKNELITDTYANFKPKVWGNINQLGI